MGYRTIVARYVATWGIAQMRMCETKCQGRGIAPFWGSANLPSRVSRDMGYRSDSITISRDMGPLRGRCHSPDKSFLPEIGVVSARKLFGDLYPGHLGCTHRQPSTVCLALSVAWTKIPLPPPFSRSIAQRASGVGGREGGRGGEGRAVA